MSFLKKFTVLTLGTSTQDLQKLFIRKGKIILLLLCKYLLKYFNRVQFSRLDKHPIRVGNNALEFGQSINAYCIVQFSDCVHSSGRGFQPQEFLKLSFKSKIVVRDTKSSKP